MNGPRHTGRVFDEAIGPKYECAEATAPGIVGNPYMIRNRAAGQPRHSPVPEG